MLVQPEIIPRPRRKSMDPMLIWSFLLQRYLTTYKHIFFFYKQGPLIIMKGRMKASLLNKQFAGRSTGLVPFLVLQRVNSDQFHRAWIAVQSQTRRCCSVACWKKDDKMPLDACEENKNTLWWTLSGTCCFEGFGRGRFQLCTCTNLQTDWKPKQFFALLCMHN